MKEGRSVCRGIGTAGQIMGMRVLPRIARFFFTSSQVVYESHYKIIGKLNKRNITTKMILVKMTTQRDMKRNMRKAKEKTGG